MNTKMVKFETVDQYIASFPPAKQRLLKEMRTLVKKAAPEAEEMISYGMPALKFHGMLLYYAAWKEHIGLYGASSTLLASFAKELAPYQQSKGTIQFPYGEPLPAGLISRIVTYRVKENLEKARAKQRSK